MDRGSLDINKFKVTRRGRKLQISDDQRTLLALPKDLPERTWAEILQKEENELVVLDVREELLEGVLKIVYDQYMNRQNALFTVHCAAEAWIKLIDWFFYRHDPGEDPSAYPPCNIPKRLESWVPDQRPDPSPKDTWGQQNLHVVEEICEERMRKWPSSSSLDLPVIEPIPSDFWFPGKVDLVDFEENSMSLMSSGSYARHRYKRARFDPLASTGGVFKVDSDSDVTPPSADLAAESELLQKVTDYSTGEISVKESVLSALKTTTPVEGSLHGAGDSTLTRKKRSSVARRDAVGPRSRMQLAPLKTLGERSCSRISTISDCRLRNLRLETQYEISSEKVDSLTNEIVKRKM